MKKITPQSIISIIGKSDWFEFNENKDTFRQFAIRNCLCKFDNGYVCRYYDRHPRAILTHFKL